MLKTVMIGVILLVTLSSCKPPTFKKPVEMFAVSQKYHEAAKGYKNLDYKKKKSTVGEWVTELEYVPLNDAPENMMCFSMKTWLTIVKPKLKEISQYHHDTN